MLISCPDCERKVSDRAKACPDCGLPVSEWVAEQTAARELEHARSTREEVGLVDCPVCDARGFRHIVESTLAGETSSFNWCAECKHTGRVIQCRDSTGYYAVAHAQLAGFLAGTIDPGADGIHALGSEASEGFRYAQVGRAFDNEEITVVTNVPESKPPTPNPSPSDTPDPDPDPDPGPAGPTTDEPE